MSNRSSVKSYLIKPGTWFRSRARERVIAGMATMPSRTATFPIAFKSIIPQVDRLYLYLDGHLEVPETARNYPRVVSILSNELPALASDGKFVGMHYETKPCLYLTVDDDIEYPPNYVSTLRAMIEAEKGRAVVGYHGSTLHRSLRSYRRDRKVFFFGKGLDRSVVVDVLGTGTTMFDTAFLKFDFPRWQNVNRNDLYFAIEAAKKRIPLICLAREHGFLRPIATKQADSIYARLKIDDSVETILAIELQRLRDDCQEDRFEQEKSPVAQLDALIGQKPILPAIGGQTAHERRGAADRGDLDN